MRRKQLNKRLRRALSSALLAALLFGAVPAFAADATDYIIKYKNGGAPFEVVCEAEMLRLRDAGLLEWYEPDRKLTLLDGETPSGETRDKWDLAMIGADAAFQMGALGEGVKVGVLDSGVNPVPCLAGKLLPGHNYLTGEKEDDTADNYGHGTLVAALIAGRDENGCLGAAPGAEIVPLKITDSKLISTSAVCRAIYGGVDDYGCGILNLSLGLFTDSKALRDAVDHAAEKGVVVVTAVGNNGTDSGLYPAEYENAIGVGAVDRDGNVYYHSNHNGSVFLTAPGAKVQTAGHRGGYTTATGTSFAVPFVTAAAAVLRGLDPRLTADEIAAILKDTARDAGDAGWDEYYGWGVLDLGSCAAAVKDRETSDLPCAFVSASSVRNGSGTDYAATYLLASYDENGACLGVKSQTLTLPAGQTVEIEAPGETGIYGQFVFETATGIPLAMARISLGNKN